jgi:hypothetical protein
MLRLMQVTSPRSRLAKAPWKALPAADLELKMAGVGDIPRRRLAIFRILPEIGDKRSGFALWQGPAHCH